MSDRRQTTHTLTTETAQDTYTGLLNGDKSYQCPPKHASLKTHKRARVDRHTHTGRERERENERINEFLYFLRVDCLK